MGAKKVLILGAGLVARPMVRYLLERGFEVIVASRTVSRAEALIDGHPAGRAVAFQVEQIEALDPLLAEVDLAVSLLPAHRHVEVARRCLALQRHLVTTSYVSPAMGDLGDQAAAAGLLFLNECGLDPGIDHMSAMQVIDRVKADGGRIAGFTSWCGGLPAAEANDNPWHYKFSWAPRGVLVAATNPAAWLEDGQQRSIPAGQLFRNFRHVEVPGAGRYEAYPNRDSASYMPIYGIEGTRTMLRGTLRHLGHCARWECLVKLGLFDATTELDFAGMTYADLLARQAPGEGELVARVARALGQEPGSADLEAMRWLGLFDATPIPLARGAAVDALADLMQRKMPFAPGERDLIVLKHEFLAEFPAKGIQEKITATMVDYGIPGGDSAMARTVSLPAAIAVRMILAGELSRTGVHRPILPEIYALLLAELKTLAIEVREASETLPL